MVLEFFLSALGLFFIDLLLNVIRSGIAKDMDFLSWLYYIPTILGQSFIFATIFFLVGFLPFSLLFKDYRKAGIIFITLLTAAQILLILNTFVFSLYKFHLNGFIFNMIITGGKEIFEFGTWIYIKFIGLIFIVGVLPFIIAHFISRRIYTKFTGKRIIWICSILLVCVVYSHLAHAVAAATKHSGIRKCALAIPYFFPLTANTMLFKMGIQERENIDNMVYNQLSSDIQYHISPIIADDNKTPGYNIVYILLDFWNPSTFSPEYMPNVYNFSKQSHIFNEHYSSANGTQGSVFALFFGLPFTYEKEFSISKMSPLFLDRLIDLDYNIQTFPSATFLSPPFNEMIFRRVPGIMTNAVGKNSFERDLCITQKHNEYIENYDSDQPFFTFMFYDLLHAINLPNEYHKFKPSWEAADYLALHNDFDPTPFFNLYKNCVFQVDSMIGNALNTLETKGLLENTIIIITGDHGQEFNENKKNYWGHSSNFSRWQIQVPFIFYYPGLEEEGKEFSHMTTHYDIAPTIMSQFLGIENPASDYSSGHSVYDSTTRYPHPVGDHINYGFIFEDMIVRTNHFGTLEITDRNLNLLKPNALKPSDIHEALTIKNRFYK